MTQRDFVLFIFVKIWQFLYLRFGVSRRVFLKGNKLYFKFPSKHLRRLEDVFSVTIFRLPRRLQDIFAIRLLKTSPRPLQGIFKTCLQNVLFRRSSKRLQEDVLQLCLEDLFKTSLTTKNVTVKTSSVRPH